MDKLMKLLKEYLEFESLLDGTPKTAASLHTGARDLELRVLDLMKNARTKEVRYFARKLYQDVSDLEIRCWRHTID